MDSLRNLIVESPTPGPETRSNLASWYTPGLSDGLGDRLLMFDNTTASSLELLRFKREFTAAPGFEYALRRRVDELAEFSHPGLARVRTVQWLGAGEGLALVSNHTIGRRLSELLHEARGPKFAAELIRQVAPILATLEQGRGFAHGVLSPDRIVVTPEGRLVVVEHVIGPAVEALRLPASRLRSELGIAVPPRSAEAVLDGRQDVVQLGYIALSLLLGRRVDLADERHDIGRLLDDAARPGPERAESPWYLRHWLERALQVHVSTFASAHHANLALEEWPKDPEDQDSGPRLSARPWEVQRPEALSGSSPLEEWADALPVEEAPESPPVEITSADILSEDEIQRPRKIEPISRRSFTFESRVMRESTTDLAEVVELLRRRDNEPVAQESPMSSLDQSAETTTASWTPARSLPKVVRWALAGLSVVAVAEAFVIAGLIIYARPASTEVASPFAVVEPLAASAGVQASAAPRTTATASAATQGRLEISSDPPGARVVVDGLASGITPVSVLVGAGEHSVVITGAGGTTRRTVNVAAGSTSALMASLAPAGAAGGWVSIDVPLELQVMEGGRLLGTTKAERIMLPAGRHNLQLTSAAAGFQLALSVEIEPGRTITRKVAIPDGVLSVNALPWANVWLDGQALGTTPVANMAVPIGTHEVVWRHPQLGERRQSVTVTVRTPVRLVMDLTK
jgi:hypothetical protein